MADYLEAYAARFELPVRLGVRVDALAKNDDGFIVAAGGLVYPLVRFGFHRLLTVRTPIGRGFRTHFDGHGKPLARVKPKHLAAAGIDRVPRTVGVRDGLPLLEDGRVLEVANIIWCTGFGPEFSWIDLTISDGSTEPTHERGVVTSQPGLYFVGLEFLHAASSSQINGVGRDAAHVVKAMAARAGDRGGPLWQLRALEDQPTGQG